MKLSAIKCCNEYMKIKVETPSYFEVECLKCGDIIYIKKGEAQKPKMIDD